MSTVEKPDFTYESDREILTSEIINIQNKMSVLTRGLQEVVTSSKNPEETRNMLQGYERQLLVLENELRKLREISGPRKAPDPASIN